MEGKETNSTRLRGVGRGRRRAWLLAAAWAVPWLIGCKAMPAGVGRSAVCAPLAAVPGPEDLVVDGDRLLVSSDDRRGTGGGGAIYSLTLPAADAPVRAQKLQLTGRDGCAFHPHGLSLVERPGADGESLAVLYVVNHHPAADATPAAGCLERAGDSDLYRRPFTSVEVFVVERHRLRFVQRLADPRVLEHGNDLVALASGDLYVTVPPTGALGLLLERAGPRPASRVVRYRCESRGLACVGEFRSVFEGGRFLNGIAHRPGTAGKQGKLYVTATLEGRLYELDLDSARDAEGRLKKSSWRSLEVPAGLDNLSWQDRDAGVLLAAGIGDLRRLAQHAASPLAASPSRLWRLELDAPASPLARVFDIDSVSGASAVVEVDGAMVVGQAWDGAVHRCLTPPSAGWPAEGRP